MKKGHLIFTIVFLLIIIAGCTEKYGGGVDKNIPTVSVKDVIINTSLKGKAVNLEGKILTQCQSKGCWFFLKDDTGHILVDLDPKGFTIPPRIGKKVKVTGVVSEESGDIRIIASGVEIY